MIVNSFLSIHSNDAAAAGGGGAEKSGRRAIYIFVS